MPAYSEVLIPPVFIYHDIRFYAWKLGCHDAVVTALCLLWHALFQVTKLRQSNVMHHVETKNSNILIDSRLFSSREHRYLFGEQFIDGMGKETDIDAKLTKWLS